MVSRLYQFLTVERGLKVTLAAGPADEGHIATYDEKIREQVVIWRKPLQETAAWFATFQYFISPDTGPMHLAAGLGLATATIFVGSDMTQYGYQEPGKKIACSIERDNMDYHTILRSIDSILSSPVSVTERMKSED